jgi:HEAT repeat protein
MELSADLQAFATDLETALNGLVKLTKALRFYPADHPALNSAAEETCNDFQPLLTHHDAQPYQVTKEGFSVAGTPVAPQDLPLRELAQKLGERDIHHLLFLPDLTNYELLVFAQEITKPAAQLLSEGGMAKQLKSRHIRSIWINETAPEAVLDLLQGMGHELSAATPAEQEKSEEQKSEMDGRAGHNRSFKIKWGKRSTINQMRDLLEILKEPQANQIYEDLLTELQKLTHSFFQEIGIAGYLAVFSLLQNHSNDNSRNSTQRQAADHLIDQLLTEPNCVYLVNVVADQNLKPSHRRALSKVLIGLKLKIAPQLLKRLFGERDAIVRRYYTGILARMGEETFDLLNDHLLHDTWHVVRNIVTILGESRLESALPLLTQVIDHPEVRVRRSVIRALGAIGSNSVIPLLLHLGQDQNEELHHPAIMALGTLKNPQAIPPLINLLKKADLFGNKTRLKTEVIQALAATKSPQAIIPLLKLARRANLLNRKSIEILRAEAILALGQLGNAQLIPVLDQLPKSDKGPVSRALKQATAHLRKQQNIA